MKPSLRLAFGALTPGAPSASLVEKNRRVYMFVSVNNDQTSPYRTAHTCATLDQEGFGKAEGHEPRW